MTGAGQREELGRTDDDQSPDFFSDGSLGAASAPGAFCSPAVALTASVTVSSVDGVRRKSKSGMFQVTWLPSTWAPRFASLTGPGIVTARRIAVPPSPFTCSV